ncbi:PREDICTED: MICAL C-terminal-like protein [Chrysochloris asiatica]|uniref:MICAL C-terminal-like protein n=1 Tax=Chrysochloris asiatica TaxID=185453 RepID=A0A9B0TL65_CHRAS|nr:PREDICTED: MICAL C-terminal-like protein [Chrysochloris asiatica]
MHTPTSPKKPKSVPEPEPSDTEPGAASPLPSEWTSVRINPQEDLVGQDVLAVCVMVNCEDSSSETESDCEDEVPFAEPYEERPQQLEPPSLPKPLTRHISLCKTLSEAVSPRCPEESKAVHDLLSVNNKRTILSPKDTSPLLSSSSSSPSSSSASIPGSASSGSSSPQVTDCSHPSYESVGPFSSSRTIFLKQTRAEGTPEEIPLYLPHHGVLERADYCLGSPGDDGCTNPKPNSPGERACEGYQEVEASLGNTRSIHRGPLSIGEKDQQLPLKTGGDIRGNSTEPRGGERGTEMAEEKSSLKKLVLTQEQKTNLLDWNSDSLSGSLPLSVGEQLSQRRSESCRGGRVLKPVCPLTLPQATRETLSSCKNSQEKVGTLTEQCPGERNTAPPKSPLRLIANAIKRSLEPLLPNSENGKKVWPKPKSKTLPTSQPHICTRSLSLRNTSYQKDWNQQSQGRDMASRASSFFSLGTPTAWAAQASDPSPPDLAFCTHSLPNHPCKIFPKPMSPPCSKIEDVPTLLEKVSLQDTLQDASRVPHRKLSLFSSLRSKDKTFESFLQESRQRMDFMDLFSRPKGKVLPVDNDFPMEKLVTPLRNKSLQQGSVPPFTERFGLTRALSCSDHPPLLFGGPKHIPIQAQVIETASALSSTSSSSADEEFDPQPSLRSKERKTIRRRKKLEKATKQLIKQEELKRLHKAQTIQRQLEEVEERQRAFEIRGVRLEKALRGEADSGAHDEAQLLQEWFKLVLEKNKLTRYESELLIKAQELELEDHQSRLEQKLREKMLKEESQKDENDLNEEQEIFTEMMQVIEQRDKLVDSLEEQRIKEKAEDEHFESFIFSRVCQLSRT